jgi:hypothetical protein
MANPSAMADYLRIDASTMSRTKFISWENVNVIAAAA